MSTQILWTLLRALNHPNSRACALETAANFLAPPVPCVPGPGEDECAERPWRRGWSRPGSISKLEPAILRGGLLRLWKTPATFARKSVHLDPVLRSTFINRHYCRQTWIKPLFHPRPQAQARAALTVALGQAVEQLIVIGSFALKECCGWEGNAG